MIYKIIIVKLQFLSWVYLIRGNEFHKIVYRCSCSIPWLFFSSACRVTRGSQRMKRLYEILSFFLYIFLVPGSFNMFALPCKRIYLKLKTKFNLYIFILRGNPVYYDFYNNSYNCCYHCNFKSLFLLSFFINISLSSFLDFI